MIKTLTLPVATIVAIASIEDPTLRQQLIDAVEKGTADPDTFRADDYADADPLIRELVSRIVRRAERSRRHAERKARKTEKAKEAENNKSKDDEIFLMPVDNDEVINIVNSHLVNVPVNDINIRRLLWFKHNFKTFVDNTLAAFKSLQGYDELYERLIPSFRYVTDRLARILAPVTKKAHDVMMMPRHSRPSILYFDITK